MEKTEPKKILVVDDEQNIRLTLSIALEPLRAEVQTAVNGEEALEFMLKQHFDIVFLDLSMPGMDGMDVLRWISKETPTTRVIIISAHGTIPSAVEAMRLGAVDFLQKPFAPMEIREIAHSVLARETIVFSNNLDYPVLIELTKRHITERLIPEAQISVRQALALDPTLPEAYNLYGAILEIKGDLLEALRFYRAALNIDPSFQPSQLNLNRETVWKKIDGVNLGSMPESDATDATKEEKQ